LDEPTHAESKNSDLFFNTARSKVIKLFTIVIYEFGTISLIV